MGVVKGRVKVELVAHHIEDECLGNRLKIYVRLLGLARVLPGGEPKHAEVLKQLMVLLAEVLEAVLPPARKRREGQQVLQLGVLAAVGLEASQQLDGGADLLGKIRPVVRGDDLALMLVVALPGLGLARLGAVRHTATARACLDLDEAGGQAHGGGLGALRGIGLATLETPGAGVPQTLDLRLGHERSVDRHNRVAGLEVFGCEETPPSAADAGLLDLSTIARRHFPRCLLSQGPKAGPRLKR